MHECIYNQRDGDEVSPTAGMEILHIDELLVRAGDERVPGRQTVIRSLQKIHEGHISCVDGEDNSQNLPREIHLRILPKELKNRGKHNVYPKSLSTRITSVFWL